LEFSNILKFHILKFLEFFVLFKECPEECHMEETTIFLDMSFKYNKRFTIINHEFEDVNGLWPMMT